MDTMTKHTPDLNSDQLLQLSDEISRISAALAKLSRGVDEHAPAIGDHAASEISEETVRWIIHARNLRARFLPSDLFSDPAWDILLELLRAEIAGQRISVSSLCIAANAPSTTALRYIKTMAEQGLIVRRPDPFDGRRVFITLTTELSMALRSYCASLLERPIGRMTRSAASGR